LLLLAAAVEDKELLLVALGLAVVAALAGIVHPLGLAAAAVEQKVR
jgi:hypothetical protein